MTKDRSKDHSKEVVALIYEDDVENNLELADSNADEEKKATPEMTTLPLHLSATLALIYMFGGILYYLLIRFSKKRELETGQQIYDSVSAVFFTEFLKWTFSVCGMLYQRRVPSNWRVCLYYAIPSGIYALYNNLTFFNLTYFDPGTYEVVMQTRVLFTGLLYTWTLQRALTHRQWMALILLTVGVIAKNYTPNVQVDGRITFMLLQASLSAFAGVYNEFLLKNHTQMNVHEQNFFMYTWALLFNLGWGYFSDPVYSEHMLSSVQHTVFWAIVVNGAILGIVTSLILKYINVIVKTFFAACEVLLTAITANVLLGDPLTTRDVVACILVMYSISVYYGRGPMIPWIRCLGLSKIDETDKLGE